MLGHPPGRLKIAGSYRVSQPIENFRLRVRIVQQKSPLAELFETEGETRDSNFLEFEEREFAWQEKVFGPFERKFYREERNCVTDAQKDYHRRLTADVAEVADDADHTHNADNVDSADNTVDPADNRLFSYTNDDSYYPDNSPLTGSYRSSLSARNSNALPAMQNHKPFCDRYNKKVIDAWPSDTRIRANHYLYRERSTMYILADLSPKDESLGSSREREHLLCTVTHDRAAKTLTIHPDFTSQNDCYSVEAMGMGYDYWIEHASRQQSADDSRQQRDALRHEMTETRTANDAETYNEMSLPTPHVLRVFLTLAIESASDFSYDALFTTYLIDLPNGWSTTDAEKLSGRTQRCRRVRGTANFGYVAEVPLDFDLKCLNDANVQPSWPYLLLSVASLDTWTRYRIEGYASVPLPPSPGYYSLELHTWRPVSGLVNALRRFFTGGTSELADMTYCGIPDAHDEPTLEKTRLKVVPAGRIRVNLCVAHQSKLFTKSRGFERDAVERLSAGTLIHSVDNVLELFKAARERMIQAMNL